MRNKWIWLIAVLALMNVGQARALKEEQREKVRRQISSVKVYQMTRELDLSENQAQALFPAQKSYEDKKSALQRQRETAESELENLLDKKADRKRITQQLDRLRKIDRQIGDNELEFRDKVKHILTLEQQARYELFQKRWDKQLREMIKDAQRENGHGARRSGSDARDSLNAREERRAVNDEKQNRSRQKTEPEQRESKDQRGTKKQDGSDEKQSPERKSSEGKSSREKGSSGQRPSRK